MLVEFAWELSLIRLITSILGLAKCMCVPSCLFMMNYHGFCHLTSDEKHHAAFLLIQQTRVTLLKSSIIYNITKILLRCIGQVKDLVDYQLGVDKGKLTDVANLESSH